MEHLLSTIKDRKKELAILSVFVVLGAFIAAASHYGTKALSGVRAYVAGESQWTKAQNRATHLLLEYGITQDRTYYKQAQQQLELHRGFRQARQAIMADNPDQALAEQGFRKAGIHPKDIDLLIWLGVTFRDVDRLGKAFAIWKEGEQHISTLDSLGRELHRSVQQGQLGQQYQRKMVAEISSLDQTLTTLETSFTDTMGGLARWVRGVILWSIIGSGMLLLVAGYLVTRRFFREIDTLNQQLTERETQLRNVLAHSRDVIYELDITSDEATYNYVSPQIETQLGYSVDQVLAGGQQFILGRIHPDDRPRVREDLKALVDQGRNGQASREVDYRIQTKDSGYIWVNAQRSLVTNENGDPIAIVGNVREITDRKVQELQTRQSLEQKQVLLEEIHHRVKNNLAVISSILELQKQEPVESVASLIEDTQSRIQSIATIHEKLYQTESLSAINIREYIDDFTDVIAQTFNSGQKDIRITKHLDTCTLDISRAVTLGLIVNELLSNAFKHGFAGREQGEIIINFATENEKATLIVADNGNPLPDDFSVEAGGSLGMTLLQTLTGQLEGTIDISQNGWKRFAMSFPISGLDIQG